MDAKSWKLPGMKKLLRIGEAAQLLGITSNAIRYYHRAGILAEPERTDGSYRLYDASDLLSLSRILRLRSLGLSIRQVREVLATPEKEEEALRSLHKELSNHIVELEKRRYRVERVLESEESEVELQSIDFSRLEEFADEFSEDDWTDTPIVEEFAGDLAAAIGAFRWPARYFGLLADLVQESARMIRDNPELDEPSLLFAKRFVVLAGLPEDSPEVERLVEKAVELDRVHPLSGEELNLFWKSAFKRNGIPPGDPFLKAIYRLVLGVFSPAQQRFWDLVNERMRELHGRGWLAEVFEEWLGT